MRRTIYKRFFEVRFLHDYYLFADNTSYFEHNEVDQKKIVEEKLRHRLLDLRKDITITPTVKTKVLMDQHKLRYFPTPLGFVVTIDVVEEIKNGETRYKPRFSIPEDTFFYFELKTKNPYFRNFTEERLTTDFESIYFFSNRVTNQLDRILSRPVSPFTAERMYEMGDLTIIGGQLNQAVRRNNTITPQNWFTRSGTGFVHTDDKTLLPAKSRYQFTTSNTIESANVSLKNTAGDILKENQYQVDKKNRVMLDFEKDNDQDEISPGEYHINIEGDNGFKEERTIQLNQEIYDPYTYGVIGITNHVEQASNKIIDADGLLVKTPISSTHPIFEIRFRSRTTFWRYLLDEEIANAPDHLIFEPAGQKQKLVARNPKSLSLTPTKFDAVPPALAEARYPNPKPYPLKMQTDGRIFSDVHINSVQKLIAT